MPRTSTARFSRPREIPQHRVRSVVAGLAAAALWIASAGDSHSQPAAPEPPAPIRLKNYQLVKNWDFSSEVTDLATLRREFHTRYIYEGGTLDHLQQEWERYRDNGNHVLDGKTLALVANAPRGLRPGEIESGMIRSKWTGKYGYYEIRMKVPHARGSWPAFWLNPEDQRWPPEIDVVEIVDNGPGATRQSFHFVHGKFMGEPDPKTSRLVKTSYRPNFDFADDFHTFAVEWTETAISHYVDDVLVVKRKAKWLHDDGTDAGPAHVLVNLGIGDKWPGPPTNLNEFPAKLEIQYVRVWQKSAQ